ncbi:MULTISPECIES: PPC domain-containing DNA-binding protein [unclassified Paracoccus (in: a-proteobacteria)]|uniref:PPC domain-containing DNA-binding protein n=1 Tax=unclassified Paracoccus (in: a-proteobacteria) TaxID=2688777 RepID=UPI001600C605|nr:MULTISPECIES: PPC domain-containing DNA-binding protein [unclassified Paracoccus (in: a-proteobacteria)]MBB1490177.1 DNA-binding protein [Paracoccus sp. MC1854]MBB1498835.1 DNA-binding protein [Paracoccus sp. MC1862]QQO43764.1 DNA-binding protein [Paracoccus sp. MC1862]
MPFPSLSIAAPDGADTAVATSPGGFAATRLQPGCDLIDGLRRLQSRTGAGAMAVTSCVGSLREVRLRHANRTEATLYQGHFEILSLTGTIDPAHQHLHLSIANGEGRAFGGHLLPGSQVFTTAEIVALLLPDLRFSRRPCPLSGFDELYIEQMPG